MSTGSIPAGEAYIKITTETGGLNTGLAESQTKLTGFGRGLEQVLRHIPGLEGAGGALSRAMQGAVNGSISYGVALGAAAATAWGVVQLVDKLVMYHAKLNSEAEKYYKLGEKQRTDEEKHLARLAEMERLGRLTKQETLEARRLLLAMEKETGDKSGIGLTADNRLVGVAEFRRKLIEKEYQEENVQAQRALNQARENAAKLQNEINTHPVGEWFKTDKYKELIKKQDEYYTKAIEYQHTLDFLAADYSKKLSEISREEQKKFDAQGKAIRKFQEEWGKMDDEDAAIAKRKSDEIVRKQKEEEDKKQRHSDELNKWLFRQDEEVQKQETTRINDINTRNVQDKNSKLKNLTDELDRLQAHQSIGMAMGTFSGTIASQLGRAGGMSETLQTLKTISADIAAIKQIEDSGWQEAKDSSTVSN